MTVGSKLSLALLVLRVFLVNHVDAPLALDNLVFGAALFHTSSNFHSSLYLAVFRNGSA